MRPVVILPALRQDMLWVEVGGGGGVTCDVVDKSHLRGGEGMATPSGLKSFLGW